MTTTVILPLQNGETTIEAVLKSFVGQPKLYEQLIIINDGSTDNSGPLVKKILSRSTIPYSIISHAKPRGLAATYNEAIKICRSELVVTLHQDVILGRGALKKIIDPFLSPGNHTIVGTYHVVSHPYWVWEKYNFWQKCYFARFVGNSYSVVGGKFNCYQRKAMMKVGLYDERKYKTAGEDADMIYKLKRIGMLVKTKAHIIHLHKIDHHFGWQDIFYKHAQYAEAKGVLFRNGRIESVQDFVKSFYRELIVLGLFLPYFFLVSLLLITMHAFLYTKIVYQKEFHNPRVLVLPLVNTIVLFVSAVFSIKGFLVGKQKI